MRTEDRSMIFNDIEEFYAQRNALRDSIRTAIKCKDVALDVRWDIFLEAGPEILGVTTFASGHIDALAPDLSVYDDFYIERHETSMYKDMYESMMEDLKWSQTFPDVESPKVATWNIDAWREAILNDGFAGFTYDW